MVRNHLGSQLRIPFCFVEQKIDAVEDLIKQLFLVLVELVWGQEAHGLTPFSTFRRSNSCKIRSAI